jgi:hypothetical protein
MAPRQPPWQLLRNQILNHLAFTNVTTPERTVASRVRKLNGGCQHVSTTEQTIILFTSDAPSITQQGHLPVLLLLSSQLMQAARVRVAASTNCNW